ncbi:TrbG/VirB9 family P-type conjugative transfer protein [Sinorhizobium fredii]|uniref:TrbG/VirB9 family P-type conjugative transfer protein n=1 Tax=Rhizobium fredii TaxID=380 RepID=UPI0004B75481|nr:TrbG/VirB9 family P-type conjugative transfer protein [Sinorhizobium fredii]
MRTAAIFALLLAGSAFSALALEIPRGASQDSRVRFVDYQPYDVTRIIGSLRSSVQVEFGPDEEIAHVASQDTYFYVKYRYPADEAERRRQAAAARAIAAQAKEADNVLAIHEAYGPRNWRYSAQGAQALEPQSVYDNGKVTTFAFVGNQEMPAIYIENSDGSESLVPKSIDGNLILVHAISRKFILRSGGDVLCVFNEAYDRVGINPDTNTTSPSVERVVRTDAGTAQ